MCLTGGVLVLCLAINGHKLSESNLLLIVFPWAFSPRTLIRGEGRDLCLPWAPAFAGVTIKSGHFDVGKIREPDALGSQSQLRDTTLAQLGPPG